MLIKHLERFMNEVELTIIILNKHESKDANRHQKRLQMLCENDVSADNMNELRKSFKAAEKFILDSAE